MKKNFLRIAFLLMVFGSSFAAGGSDRPDIGPNGPCPPCSVNQDAGILQLHQ